MCVCVRLQLCFNLSSHCKSKINQFLLDLAVAWNDSNTPVKGWLGFSSIAVAQQLPAAAAADGSCCSSTPAFHCGSSSVGFFFFFWQKQIYFHGMGSKWSTLDHNKWSLHITLIVNMFTIFNCWQETLLEQDTCRQKHREPCTTPTERDFYIWFPPWSNPTWDWVLGGLHPRAFFMVGSILAPRDTHSNFHYVCLDHTLRRSVFIIKVGHNPNNCIGPEMLLRIIL